MTIIKIEPYDNGGHANQTSAAITPPDGWAIVPDTLQPLENFPFGEVEAEEIDGTMTVTKWTPLPIPEPEPAPDPGPTEVEQLRADVDYIMVMEGL